MIFTISAIHYATRHRTYDLAALEFKEVNNYYENS